MSTARRQRRNRRSRSLSFGAALAVSLGLTQTGPAMAQVEPTPPDLEVTKTSDAGGTVGEGVPITYTITITNVGGSTAEDVELHDTLPPGMGGIAPGPMLKDDVCRVLSSIRSGGYPQATVECGPVSLEPDGSATVAIEADTNHLCGRIVNAVEVEASNEPNDLQANNTAQVSDQGPACNPDISVDVAASPDEGPVGATITYTYTVTNTGESTLYGISVRDDRLGSVIISDGFSLRPGATDRFTATVTLGSNPVTSVVTAAGQDVAGHRVSAVDEVTVSVVSAGGDTNAGSGGGEEAVGAGGTPFTGAGTAALGVFALLLSGLGGLLVSLTGRRSRPS